MKSSENQTASSVVGKTDEFVFIPGRDQVMSGRFRLRYNTCRNEYYMGGIETFSTQKKAYACGWNSVVYSYENIHRVIDSTCDEAYLERTNHAQNARVCWKFDFTTTGLVLDKVNMKMPFEEKVGGQVAVCVSGDTGMKWEPYYSAGTFVSMKSLSGSQTLMIAVNLIGEDEGQITRIMTQPLSKEDFDCPFDVQIRLQRPDFTLGRSLLFLGLMFSNNENNSHKNSRKSQTPVTEGCVHIHVQNAKRLPCRRNGSYAEPKVKCTIHSDKNTLPVKTKAHPKTLNPNWNEFLVIPDVSMATLHRSRLDIQIKHSKRLLKRSKEVLGYVSLKQHQILMYDGLIEKQTQNQANNSVADIRDPSVSVMSLTKTDITENNGDTKQTVANDGENQQHSVEFKGDIQPQFSQYVSTDSNNNDSNNVVDTPFDDDVENITFRNSYYRDILKDANQQNNDDDDAEDDTFEILPSAEEIERQDKYIEIENINITESETDSSISETKLSKRRTISVDNSVIYSHKNYKLRPLETFSENPTENDTQHTKLRRSHSMSDIIERNRNKPPRKKTFSRKLFRSGSISNIIEDSVFEEKARKLSYDHWSIVLNNPGQWFYCWHPLLGVNNIME
ncbi:uncharacterized protein LOC130621160 [Hydractinia symbiolongicarpus]|uniref:uncharacterized protein LOC130621160 n=1 Tax=Hydractinia symbiolongicarpus TaxID=13093 RepID=UPI00254EB7E3|nr:uncharacterized protein LOC130621160 [Hydractinia symbiolongicarpus]